MKKGFIFVETMVCIAFLSTVLLTVYASFTTVLDNAKTRLLYDDPIYLYRTYYILNFLEENGLNEYINEKFNNQANNTSYIFEFGCTAAAVNDEGTKSEKVFCEKILQNGEWEVNHVFVMPYNVNKVVNCANNENIQSGEQANCRRNPALKNLSVQAVNFLYSLDGYTGSPEEDDILNLNNYNEKVDPAKQIYRIVIEFKVKDKEETYTYYDYCLSNKGTCSTFNPNEGKQEYTVTKYKYYYTSLEIPNGYNQVATSTGYNLKIKYDGNGGTWCGNSSSNWTMLPNTTYAYHTIRRSEYITYPSGQKIDATNGLADYDNEDYICFEKDDMYAVDTKEWNTKPNGTGVTFDQSDTSLEAETIANAIGCDLSKNPCTVVLYANWVPAQTFNLTLNLNGGSAPPGVTYPTTYKNNQQVEIPDPIYTDKVFKGWTGMDITTPRKDLKIPKGSTGDRIYDANWQDKYTITYTNCGTKSATGMPEEYLNGTGGGATINGVPTNGTKVFNGYEYNSTKAFSHTIASTETGDKTFTCMWCEPCTTTVSHGSCTLISSTAGTCTYNTSCDPGYNYSSGENTNNPICVADPPPTVNISNSSHGNWTNQDVRLELETNYGPTAVDYWYYSYSNLTANTSNVGTNPGSKWVKYDGSHNRKEFTVIRNASEELTIYFMVCGTNNKCGKAYTSVKIDKIPPELNTNPGFGKHCYSAGEATTYPGTTKKYGAIVGSWKATESGSVKSGLKYIYMRQKWNNTCIEFTADATSNTFDGLNVWVNNGGNVDYLVGACDNAGNCRHSTGTTECSKPKYTLTPYCDPPNGTNIINCDNFTRKGRQTALVCN